MVHAVETREVVRIQEEGGAAVTDTIARRAALLRRVSWGGIIAGTTVAMALQLLFTTLGAGIGLAVVDTAGRGIAIGAGIWWLITALISLYIGGMVAGRLAGFPQKVEAALHGVLVWSLTALIGLLFMSTSAAALIGGALGPMSRGYSNARGDYDGNRITSGLSTMGDEAMNQVNRLGQPTSPRSPDARPVEGPTLTDARRAATTLSGAALWTFFSLLLGCGAACMGGQHGRPPVGVTLD